MNQIDEILNRPQALTFQVVLASALGAIAVTETINSIADGDWVMAVIPGVAFLALAYLASRAMGVIEYRLSTADPEAIKAAQAEVADNFSRWSMANEIGEKIDWEHFGRIVECYSPLDDDDEEVD